MDQKKLSEETELGNCHIGRSSSLESLHTADTDTNVSGLDHRHVVGTITNS
jgi:hypothetical protein